jgi:hypothetical protein
MNKAAKKGEAVAKKAKAKPTTAKVETAKAFTALAHACEPFYHSLMADDARHDRDSLAKKMDEFIRKDPMMVKHRDAIIAHNVVERIIEKTSSHQFIDDNQMRMFSREDDLKEYLDHCSFECGDGLVLRASATQFADLEREQARVDKNALEASARAAERKAKLERLRPLMVVQGLSRTEAELVLWRELKAQPA